MPLWQSLYCVLRYWDLRFWCAARCANSVLKSVVWSLKLFSLTNRRNSISAGATPRIGCQDASSRTQFAFVKTAAPQGAAVFSR